LSYVMGIVARFTGRAGLAWFIALRARLPVCEEVVPGWTLTADHAPVHDLTRTTAQLRVRITPANGPSARPAASIADRSPPKTRRVRLPGPEHSDSLAIVGDLNLVRGEGPDPKILRA
jgi:hypothetical protein